MYERWIIRRFTVQTKEGTKYYSCSKLLIFGEQRGTMRLKVML